MKKFLIIFIILLCVGCGKKEVTIIYVNENNDETKITDNADSEVTLDDSSKTENANISDSITSIDSVDTREDEYSNQNTIDEVENSDSSKIKDKVKDTYNSAKNWYNENKDEIKETNKNIIEEDKNTINELYGSAKNWYNENKDTLKSKAKEVYENDKSTIKDLYDKFKN